jgi:hypothetical protein
MRICWFTYSVAAKAMAVPITGSHSLVDGVRRQDASGRCRRHSGMPGMLSRYRHVTANTPDLGRPASSQSIDV